MRTILIILFLFLSLISIGQDIPQQSWLAIYYDAGGNVISTRVEPNIHHDFNVVLMPGVEKEGLGARWVGNWQLNKASKLAVNSDKSIRVIVQDQEVISDIYNNQPNSYSVDVPAGLQMITVEYNLPAEDPKNPVIIDGIALTVSEYERRADGKHPYPKYLLDGNPADSSRWSVEGLNQWAVFKLPEVKTIHSVDIAWAFSRTNIFDLKISTDSIQWKTLYDKAQSTLAAEQLQTFDFPDTTGQYIMMVVQGYGDSTRNWNSVSEFAISYSDIIEPPIDPPIPPPSDAQIDIVRQGYFIVLVDGVQLGGGHSEFDKAVEKAVNAALADPGVNVLIQAPTWGVEYR